MMVYHHEIIVIKSIVPMKMYHRIISYDETTL